MKWKEPVTIGDIQEELLVHSKDGRSDPGFRLNIALAQIGNLAAHFTHDQKENPISRPYGTRDAEISDAGHAIVQLMTYCALRGINLQQAINMALLNLREKDFIKRSPSSSGNSILGQTGMVGTCIGLAFVDPHMERTPKHEGMILVTNHPKSDARLKKFAGIVTNHGGTNCHAAIIARECGIPCVVGTGNATGQIKTGEAIEITATENVAMVRVI